MHRGWIGLGYSIACTRDTLDTGPGPPASKPQQRRDKNLNSQPPQEGAYLTLFLGRR